MNLESRLVLFEDLARQSLATGSRQTSSVNALLLLLLLF
jgi:hypothetical protein